MCCCDITLNIVTLVSFFSLKSESENFYHDQHIEWSQLQLFDLYIANSDILTPLELCLSDPNPTLPFCLILIPLSVSYPTLSI